MNIIRLRYFPEGVMLIKEYGLWINETFLFLVIVEKDKKDTFSLINTLINIIDLGLSTNNLLGLLQANGKLYTYNSSMVQVIINYIPSYETHKYMNTYPSTEDSFRLNLDKQKEVVNNLNFLIKEKFKINVDFIHDYYINNNQTEEMNSTENIFVENTINTLQEEENNNDKNKLSELITDIKLLDIIKQMESSYGEWVGFVIQKYEHFFGEYLSDIKFNLLKESLLLIQYLIDLKECWLLENSVVELIDIQNPHIFLRIYYELKDEKVKEILQNSGFWKTEINEQTIFNNLYTKINPQIRIQKFDFSQNNGNLNT